MSKTVLVDWATWGTFLDSFSSTVNWTYSLPMDGFFQSRASSQPFYHEFHICKENKYKYRNPKAPAHIAAESSLHDIGPATSLYMPSE